MLILVLGSPEYAKPFKEFGNITYDKKEIISCDAVVFTGGSDVTPEIYGQKKQKETHSYLDRDIEEAGLFHIALLREIPMFGICRGSQFLTVMSGGSLRQHVHNHAKRGTHAIHTVYEDVVQVTSTHHQMMDLSPLTQDRDYFLLAWADGLNKGGDIEPEAVEFPLTKTLAVQFHPEYMDEKSDGWKYYQSLVFDHLFYYSDEEMEECYEKEICSQN